MRVLLALLACLIALPVLAETAPEERRAEFGAWLASCRADGFCAVESRAGAPEPAASFRVEQPSEGAPFGMVVTLLSRPARDADVVFISVIGREVAILRPDPEVGAEFDNHLARAPGDPERALRIEPGRANETVLPFLELGEEAGAEILVGLGGPGVSPAPLRFPLGGLGAAIRWFARTRGH